MHKLYQMEREIQWLLTEKYKDKKSPEFQRDVKRLKSGEPLAYVIGTQPFLDIIVSLVSRPLIPRVETEFWVDRAISEMRDTNDEIRVLDLCAGSGCIGSAVLKQIPRSFVHFIERDVHHHVSIEDTLRINNIDRSRAMISGGDLFETACGQYDFILTNPPYVDANLRRVEESVIRYEPQEALFSAENGFGHIRRILKDFPSFLKYDGTLYIEHEPEHRDAFHQMMTASIVALHYEDQYGVTRYSKIRVLQS